MPSIRNVAFGSFLNLHSKLFLCPNLGLALPSLAYSYRGSLGSINTASNVRARPQFSRLAAPGLGYEEFLGLDAPAPGSAKPRALALQSSGPWLPRGLAPPLLGAPEDLKWLSDFGCYKASSSQ